MERNEKELISVKTINIFNIIYYISNGPKKDTCKAVFKNIFITTTCDCKHENINFMKLWEVSKKICEKIWELWEI